MYPPFQENEMITFFIGCGIFLFLLINFKKFREVIPHFPFLFLSFLCLFLGHAATNLEAFIWPRQLNLLEHFGYASNMVFLAIWIYCVLYRSRREG